MLPLPWEYCRHVPLSYFRCDTDALLHILAERTWGAEKKVVVGWDGMGWMPLPLPRPDASHDLHKRGKGVRSTTGAPTSLGRAPKTRQPPPSYLEPVRYTSAADCIHHVHYRPLSILDDALCRWQAPLPRLISCFRQGRRQAARCRARRGLAWQQSQSRKGADWQGRNHWLVARQSKDSQHRLTRFPHVGVPAAFSPSCSESHVPGYINSPKLKDAGKVFVVSVNDAFV